MEGNMKITIVGAGKVGSAQARLGFSPDPAAL